MDGINLASNFSSTGIYHFVRPPKVVFPADGFCACRKAMVRHLQQRRFQQMRWSGGYSFWREGLIVKQQQQEEEEDAFFICMVLRCSEHIVFHVGTHIRSRFQCIFSLFHWGACVCFKLPLCFGIFGACHSFMSPSYAKSLGTKKGKNETSHFQPEDVNLQWWCCFLW